MNIVVVLKVNFTRSTGTVFMYSKFEVEVANAANLK